MRLVRLCCVALALCVLRAAWAQGQTVLFPVPQPLFGELKILLDREIDGLATSTDPRLKAWLATTYAMLGDADRAAELSAHLTAAERRESNARTIEDALRFQGSAAHARAQFRRETVARLEAAQKALDEQRRTAPFQEPELKNLEDAVALARAKVVHEEVLARAMAFFAQGRVDEAIGVLDELGGDEGATLRVFAVNEYLRTLALGRRGREALEFVARARGVNDFGLWQGAQLLAFRDDFDSANRLAEHIGGETSWRGAKLGIALAMARRGETGRARAIVREVVGNRGRPLARGAALGQAELLPLLE